MELICIREHFRANKKGKQEQQNLSDYVSEQSAEQNAATYLQLDRIALQLEHSVDEG